MNTQMMICMVIFAATLISYMLNKIPMWLTAMISLTALYFTGCIDANGAMAGFSNVNTILMATMFIVASGFRRTSVVDVMCSAIMKLTHGSFLTAYFGYILLAVLLTNFIASPMVVYAIVSPLLAALCEPYPVHVPGYGSLRGMLWYSAAVHRNSAGRTVYRIYGVLRIYRHEYPCHRLHHRHLADSGYCTALGVVDRTEIYPKDSGCAD